MQIEGATKLELDLRDILVWNEGFCLGGEQQAAIEASLRSGILSCACEELQRLRKRVEELEEQLRWRKWPEERPPAGGRYFVATDGSTDIYEHVSYYSTSIGWATKDAGISHWRPIDLPGGVG